jgi:N-acetylneuraminate synthase
MKYDSRFFIDGHEISLDAPTYFIADIGANHEGDLERAKDLICLARQSGADAVKFQHFLATKIVSDYGFKQLGSQLSHQTKWGKPVFDIYKQYECNRQWTEKLVETAKNENITFLTSPYDFEAVEQLDTVLPAYKIGSGDITWLEFIEHVAKKNKPVLLATGAADMNESVRAADMVLKHNRQIALMQCNTNYTGSAENYRCVNLNVLRSFAVKYPGMVLGLSDHTFGHTAVLGAIALGAKVIEKHFTDDNARVGPDHPFAMNPKTWRVMVDAARELEAALGDGIKRVEDNEKQTVVLQRRCIRAACALKAGDVLTEGKLEFLRPSPAGALEPHQIDSIRGKTLLNDKTQGDALYPSDIA